MLVVTESSPVHVHADVHVESRPAEHGPGAGVAQPHVASARGGPAGGHERDSLARHRARPQAQPRPHH